MGIFKAGIGAFSGALSDQWREYFYCEALPADVLVRKGVKRISGRSSNTTASDNIISNGSIIAVADGQCMIIVEQGKVVDVCAEPGEFVYDQSTEPSLLYNVGDFAKNFKDVFKTMGKRFTFGGDTGKDQRVYYFNTKEIMGNKYGTPSAVPFRVFDDTINMKFNINLRCFGEYSYKIVNPVLFYTNVCGNVTDDYNRQEIDGQLKTELLTSLQKGFAVLSSNGVQYFEIPGHADELADILNDVLSKKWSDLRGISIVSFGVSSVKADEEDEKAMKEMQRDMQRAAALSNPAMGGGFSIATSADALRTAAANQGGMGQTMGFMGGMGLAQNLGGGNAAALYNAAAQQQQQQMQQQYQQQQFQQQHFQQPMPNGAVGFGAAPAQQDGWKCECGTMNQGKFCANCGKAKPEPKQGWKCECGAVNEGKFCANCGKPQPAAPQGWTCACGAVNQGKFCANCGQPKPAGAPLYKCDKCGWEPEDPAHPPKFCPQCGDVFDDNDKI